MVVGRRGRLVLPRHKPCLPPLRLPLQVNEMKGHSSTLVLMGAFLLWFGFYGFNPGANLTIATRVGGRMGGWVGPKWMGECWVGAGPGRGLRAAPPTRCTPLLPTSPPHAPKHSVHGWAINRTGDGQAE